MPLELLHHLDLLDGPSAPGHWPPAHQSQLLLRVHGGVGGRVGWGGRGGRRVGPAVHGALALPLRPLPLLLLGPDLTLQLAGDAIEAGTRVAAVVVRANL